MLAVLFAALLPAGALSAQTEYQTALDRSLAAHAAGDHVQARVFMEQAHALEPSARTLRGLGVVAYADGRHVDAIFHLEGALSSPVRPLTPELQTAVEELLARSWKEVARVRLSLDPVHSEVTLDGAAPAWHAPNELLVAAGVHRLSVRAEGRLSYVLDLRLAPGASETVHVVLAEQPSAPAGGPALGLQAAAPLVVSSEPTRREHGDLGAPVPVPARESTSLRWWTPRLRNGVLIAGGAVALTSIALWATAARRFGILEEHCAAQPAGGCDQTEADRVLSDSHVPTYQRAAAVTTALAGATLAGALGLTLWQRYTRSEPALAVRLAPGELALRGKF